MGAVFLASIGWLGTWTLPDMNSAGKTTVHTSIHGDGNRHHLTLSGRRGTHFDIFWVENAEPKAINPSFPSIHIQTTACHNAWIHMVYTDSKIPEWTIFIDAQNKHTSGTAYPFYTYEQDFYDAPLWTYSVFNKPIHCWKGHAFAVTVNHDKKTIHCVGGIQWGFELSWFKLRPVAIHPSCLSQQDWEKAWQMVQKNTARVFFNLPKQVERIPLDDFMSEFQYGIKDAKGGIIS
jgi:hypothetical protein